MSMRKVALDKHALSDIIKTITTQDGVFPLTVKGTSMEPFLKDGKTVVNLKKHTYVKKGRIYLFKHNDGLLLHRLIGVRDNTLMFRGDAQRTIEHAKRDDILAEVTNYTYKDNSMNPDALTLRMRTSLWNMLGPLRPKIARLLNKRRH